MPVGEGSPVDVMNKQRIIVPVVRDLIVLDRSNPAAYRPDERAALHTAKVAVVQEQLLPIWRRTGGKVLTDEHAVFEGENDIRLQSSVVVGDEIFVAARNPYVKDSLLVGKSVFGTTRVSPEFGPGHFTSLIALARGITEGNEGQVRQSLTKLDGIIRRKGASSYDMLFHGKLGVEDAVYNGFGTAASAAKIVDEWYIPSLFAKDTAGAVVENSVIYGTETVFPNLLGGKVSHAIIGTVNPEPFRDAHIRVEDAVLLGRGEKYARIRGTYTEGYPDLAKDAVQAIGEAVAMAGTTNLIASIAA
jgi:hypothetical protein